MAKVTVKKPIKVDYVLELNQEEAELLTALLGRTNSVHESVSDDIYDALIIAGVPDDKFEIIGHSVITLKPKE